MHANGGGIMGNQRTYSASIPKVLFTVISIFLIVEVSPVLLYLSAQSVLSKRIFGALSFAILPLLAVLSFLAFNIKIEITEQDIRFYRFNRNYRTIPFAKHRIHTHVHTIKIQYAIPLDLLYLKVIYPDGMAADIKLHLFSRKSFHRLDTEIRTIIERTKDSDRNGSDKDFPKPDVVRKDEHAEFGGSDLPFGGVLYTFPKKEYLKLMRHNLIVNFYQTVFLILFLAGFSALIFLSGVPMSARLLYALSAPALIALAILAGIFLILWLVYRKRTRNVPEKIRITENFIQIDDDRFSLSKIRQIKLDNVGELRYLNIDSSDRSKNYCLAHNISGRKVLCYLEYSALYRSLDAFMRQVGKRAL
jgi:hypothetical protein